MCQNKIGLHVQKKYNNHPKFDSQHNRGGGVWYITIK